MHFLKIWDTIAEKAWKYIWIRFAVEAEGLIKAGKIYEPDDLQYLGQFVYQTFKPTQLFVLDLIHSQFQTIS